MNSNPFWAEGLIGSNLVIWDCSALKTLKAIFILVSRARGFLWSLSLQAFVTKETE